MKTIYTLIVACILLGAGIEAMAQSKAPTRYEVEILSNPTAGKRDTREVNSVVIFESEKVIVQSRRNAEVFKEIKYSDIKFVEHSYSKRPWFSTAAASAVTAVFTGLPIWFGNGEKHWISIVAEGDFFVLKLENDNYRQIKAEFMMRGFKVENIKEGKDGQKPAKPIKKDEDKAAPSDDKNKTTTGKEGV